MREAVIVAACRTAVGKAPRGVLKDTRPEHMGCRVLGDLVERAGNLDPMLIDDVMPCINTIGVPDLPSLNSWATIL